MNTNFNMANFWYQKWHQAIDNMHKDPSIYAGRIAAIAQAEYVMYVAQGSVRHV